uniref:Uncharacterized protein n=1 Tax=Glossina brevipalpis TaxID=37001 RepID=A0A1A9X3G6_9MUSC
MSFTGTNSKAKNSSMQEYKLKTDWWRIRAEESKRKKRVERQRQRQRQRRGAKVFRCVNNSTGHLTLAPSRLFEKTPMSPSDSLDEIALQIPRESSQIFNEKKYRRQRSQNNIMQIGGIIAFWVAAGIIRVLVIKSQPSKTTPTPSPEG